MSRKGQHQDPWLEDHVVFFCYRWLSWGIAVAMVALQGSWERYWSLLLITALWNVVSTSFAQLYVRLARRSPLILLVDICYTALMLIAGDGWGSPFAMYALSSLVLPGLLFGLPGSLLAGLAFMPVYLGATWAILNEPPIQLFVQGEEGQRELMLTMAAPLLYAGLFPSLIGLLRQALSRRPGRAPGRSPLSSQPIARDATPDPLSRYPLGLRDGSSPRDGPVEEAPLTTRLAMVRDTEQGTDDLRRVVFTPFPTVDVELPAALDILSRRYGEYTGLLPRVILLGRPRYVQRAQRAVLTRLAQEALLNVHQHAHAALVELTLRFDAQSVVLLIQDDGVGLLDGTYERPRLHALRAMHYRLTELGGRLDVFETDGGGVTVRATMPLE